MISADACAEAGRLRNAWGTFLDRWSWDWFVTLTFKEPPHPEQADKLFRVLVSKINRKLYGVRWAKHRKGVRWVRATELHRRGAIHFHVLMGGDGLSTERRLFWMDVWHGLGGAVGFARIEVPESQGAVLGYCSVRRQGGRHRPESHLGPARPTRHVPGFPLPLCQAPEAFHADRARGRARTRLPPGSGAARG